MNKNFSFTALALLTIVLTNNSFAIRTDCQATNSTTGLVVSTTTPAVETVAPKTMREQYAEAIALYASSETKEDRQKNRRAFDLALAQDVKNEIEFHRSRGSNIAQATRFLEYAIGNINDQDIKNETLNLLPDSIKDHVAYYMQRYNSNDNIAEQAWQESSSDVQHPLDKRNVDQVAYFNRFLKTYLAILDNPEASEAEKIKAHFRIGSWNCGITMKAKKNENCLVFNYLRNDLNYDQYTMPYLMKEPSLEEAFTHFIVFLNSDLASNADTKEALRLVKLTLKLGELNPAPKLSEAMRCGYSRLKRDTSLSTDERATYQILEAQLFQDENPAGAIEIYDQVANIDTSRFRVSDDLIGVAIISKCRLYFNHDIEIPGDKKTFEQIQSEYRNRGYPINTDLIKINNQFNQHEIMLIYLLLKTCVNHHPTKLRDIDFDSKMKRFHEITQGYIFRAKYHEVNGDYCALVKKDFNATEMNYNQASQSIYGAPIPNTWNDKMDREKKGIQALLKVPAMYQANQMTALANEKLQWVIEHSRARFSDVLDNHMGGFIPPTPEGQEKKRCERIEYTKSANTHRIELMQKIVLNPLFVGLPACAVAAQEIIDLQQINENLR